MGEYLNKEYEKVSEGHFNEETVPYNNSTFCTYIKEFKLFNFTILRISYDGIHDQYWLFNRYKIFQKENDRDFWNDWE